MENSEQALHLCSLTKRHASLLTVFFFSAPHCKHPLLISALARNEVHCSLEIELRIRIAMKHWHLLALPGLKIQWLFLTIWKTLDSYRIYMSLESYCRSSIEVEVRNSQPPPNLPSDRVINCLHRWLNFSLRATSLSLEVIQADSSKASCIKLLLSLITILIIHLQLYSDSILIAWPFHCHHLCWLWIELMHNSKEEQKIT